ncbi:MAG: cupredoxin domain-containing protein [Patescibacteria group bacterium]
MNKNLFVALGAIVVLAVAVVVAVKMKPDAAEPTIAPAKTAEPTPTAVTPTPEPATETTSTTEPTNPDQPTVAATVTVETDTAIPTPIVAVSASIREFTMQSFVEFVDDKPMPQYSVKELTVKKGEKVRLKVTNTKGMHDFNIDEFGIKAQTPLNQEVVIEFTADKTGEFVYYCNLPGHRQAGHWGTLKVTE